MEESFNIYCDFFFDCYCVIFDLDLKLFFDKEGLMCYIIFCLLKDFVEVMGGMICF